MSAIVLRADARALPLLDCSVDAIVCDPPYGLEFMGKEWDRPWAVGMSRPGYGDAERMARPSFGDSRNANCQACGGRQRGANRCACDTPAWDRHPREDMAAFQAWCTEWAAEALRVLKPGGWLLAFGGTRTAHRLVCGIEDAGFEIRDSITWLYGSGFPKSLDVSKAIDAAAGVEREVIGEGDRFGRGSMRNRSRVDAGYRPTDLNPDGGAAQITAPVTADAARWDGWGTALKPGSEPIVVVRKPLVGTVAANVLAYGTGALNIDACRVEHLNGENPSEARRAGASPGREIGSWANDRRSPETFAAERPGEAAGRWPTNVVLDEHTAADLDAQSGTLTSGANPTRRSADKFRDAYGEFKGQEQCTPARGTDSGGASRFFPTFRYQAKAPTEERPVVNGVAHPTVKPLDLMRWLVRLVTQPGGLVLDPFAGSGTTVEAAMLEGFDVIGIERDAQYLPLIRSRMDRATRRQQPGITRLIKPRPPLDGQGDLFADLLDGAA